MATPDYLTMYAQAQPDKLAVIDDRPSGRVDTMTFLQLEEQANRLAHVLLAHGVRQSTKVVWCGQNSPGVVTLVNASRKIGATAVPLNYRLSDEEATYVTDHSDAQVVYVDSEFAPLFERIRGGIPKVKSILVYDGPVPSGMEDVGALMAAAPATPAEVPAATEPGDT